jgi:hypothetical protein
MYLSGNITELHHEVEIVAVKCQYVQVLNYVRWYLEWTGADWAGAARWSWRRALGIF